MTKPCPGSHSDLGFSLLRAPMRHVRRIASSPPPIENQPSSPTEHTEYLRFVILTVAVSPPYYHAEVTSGTWGVES